MNPALFTGLIEEKGHVLRLSASPEGAALQISAEAVLGDLKIGDSVAVSGPCLTVTAVEKNGFTVWVMPETLQKTNLGSLKSGQPVNLERAMTLGGRLGGHLVSGHIDAVITLINRRPEGSAIILSFSAPEELLRYVVAKGSVALDGVSLTVIEVDQSGFKVGLIPLSASETTLGRIENGAKVNLEVDLIGKYVEKMLQPRPNDSAAKETITMAFLQEKGYL